MELVHSTCSANLWIFRLCAILSKAPKNVNPAIRKICLGAAKLYLQLSCRRLIAPSAISTRRMVVAWNFRPVAIIVRKPRHTEVSVADSTTKGTREAEQDIDDAEGNSTVCVARQVVLKSIMQHLILVTRKSSGLWTIEPRMLRSSGQCTLAAQRIMNVSLRGLFYFLVTKFFNREVHFLEKNKHCAYGKFTEYHTCGQNERSKNFLY